MIVFFFFFKQKTAYEMRISDWSSDVCSSDLRRFGHRVPVAARAVVHRGRQTHPHHIGCHDQREDDGGDAKIDVDAHGRGGRRSEEHTSELQSLMRISYAVFCLKKKIYTSTYYYTTLYTYL